MDEPVLVYALSDLQSTLMSVPSLANIIILLVAFVRSQWPGFWTAERAVGLTLVMGPSFMAGVWTLGFLPAAVTWREAVAMGLIASVTANGGYAAIKALIETKQRKQRR